jgi:hypothetical protein
MFAIIGGGGGVWRQAVFGGGQYLEVWAVFERVKGEDLDRI